MFTVYSKDNCQYCKLAIEYLDNRYSLHEVNVIKVSSEPKPQEMSIEEFKEKFPGVTSLPLIIHNNLRVGGYKELITYFKETVERSLKL